MPGYKTKYEQFVTKNAVSILTRLSNEYETHRDDALLNTVSSLISYENLIPAEAIDAALKLASSKQLTRLSAILIGSSRPQKTAASEFEFDL
jgi:hypothetical protein